MLAVVPGGGCVIGNGGGSYEENDDERTMVPDALLPRDDDGGVHSRKDCSIHGAAGATERDRNHLERRGDAHDGEWWRRPCDALVAVVQEGNAGCRLPLRLGLRSDYSLDAPQEEGFHRKR